MKELQKGNHLIILDNFEDASQPVAEKFYDHFFERVDELPECKSKIIITGRTALKMHQDLGCLVLFSRTVRRSNS